MSEGQVKIEKKSHGSMLSPTDEYYPYGTSLNFEDDMVDSLGLSGVKVGDMVEVKGYAKVESVSERSDEEGSSKNVGLQLTSVSVSTGEKKSAVDQMYGSEK